MKKRKANIKEEVQNESLINPLFLGINITVILMCLLTKLLLGNTSFWIVTATFGSITVASDIFLYAVYSYLKDKRISAAVEYKYLSDEIEKEEQKLEELKQIKTKQKEPSNTEVHKVNDLEALNNLKNKLEFYRNLGYNLREYYILHKAGQLDEHLSNEGHSKADIEIIKEYVEEKGQTLTKKNKRRIKQ